MYADMLMIYAYMLNW